MRGLQQPLPSRRPLLANTNPCTGRLPGQRYDLGCSATRGFRRQKIVYSSTVQLHVLVRVYVQYYYAVCRNRALHAERPSLSPDNPAEFIPYGYVQWIGVVEDEEEDLWNLVCESLSARFRDMMEVRILLLYSN